MPNALETAATSLLGIVVAVAAELKVDLPAKRYVAAGAAGNEPWDCDQVTVALAQLEPMHAHVPGDLVTSTVVTPGVVSLPTAVLRAEIVRCVPVHELNKATGTFRLPPVEEEQAAGLATMVDAWLLHTARNRVIVDGALTGSRPSQVRAGSVVPVGPEGGWAGVNLTVAVTLL